MRIARATDTPADIPGKLSPEELSALIALADELTGIQLDESKETLIYTRLVRRLRALRMPSFLLYIDLLRTGDEGEIQEFVNAVTTNLTYFFREPHHFEFMKKEAVPELLASSTANKPLRLWCSACSSGEEAYSMAMVMSDLGLRAGADYRLLCTDVNTEMVESTRLGSYDVSDARGLDEQKIAQYFSVSENGVLQANESLRLSMICKPLNLFQRWPIRFGVDIIFCRNVLIYFNSTQHTEIVTNFARLQAAGSFLFLGHSETVRGVSRYYTRVSNTVFQRTDAGVP